MFFAAAGLYVCVNTAFLSYAYCQMTAYTPRLSWFMCVQSQDAALHLVQALRFELEQRFDVQEECRAYGEHCDSELCFDMDMPKSCCCPSQERSRTMLSVA